LCQEMEPLRIAVLIGIVTLFGACSKNVDEETLTRIDEHLSAIENIDAQISQSSRETEAIEAELAELWQVIERVETEKRKALLGIRKELERVRAEVFRLGETQDAEQLLREVREVAEENIRLRERIAELEGRD